MRLFGSRYTVKLQDGLVVDEDGTGCLGLCQYGEKRILLANLPGTHPDRLLQVFFHELMHAIADELGMDQLSERDCDGFARGLTSFCVENGVEVKIR